MSWTFPRNFTEYRRTFQRVFPDCSMKFPWTFTGNWWTEHSGISRKCPGLLPGYSRNISGGFSRNFLDGNSIEFSRRLGSCRNTPRTFPDDRTKGGTRPGFWALDNRGKTKETHRSSIKNIRKHTQTSQSSMFLCIFKFLLCVTSSLPPPLATLRKNNDKHLEQTGQLRKPQKSTISHCI